MDKKLKDFTIDLENSGFMVNDHRAVRDIWLALKDTGNGHIPAVILDGPPGVGKTYLAEKTAQVTDAEVIFFQFYRGAGKEELLFDLDLHKVIRGMSGKDESEHFKDMIAPGVLLQACELSKSKKVILILDEIDKAHPSVDAYMLDFLQYARLNIPHIGEVKPNTKNLVVIFTKNDERDLSEPLIRRCRNMMVKMPSIEVEVDMVQKLADVSLNLAKVLVTLTTAARANKRISTPEIIRLAKDIIILYDEVLDGSCDKYIIGQLVVDSLFGSVHPKYNERMVTENIINTL